MNDAIPPDSSLQRFLIAIRGNPAGGPFQRILYYAFRVIIGGIVGFLIIAMATPARERGGQGFGLEIYLAAIAAGAAAALAMTIVPRLLRPKDWPTRDEFRRGAPPPKGKSES